MIAVVALAWATPSLARAQFVEGSVVQVEDGTLYVFENGRLHAVEPIRVSVDDVATAPVGDPVQYGVAIIQPPAPVAVVPEPPAAGLAIAVLNVERPFRASRNASSGREWVVLRVRINNGTTQAWNTGSFAIGNPDVYVVDSRGSSLEVSPLDIPEAIRSNTTIPPGGSLEGTLAFAVPVGVPLTKLQWFQGGSLLMESAIP
jgi:hypothetical protein